MLFVLSGLTVIAIIVLTVYWDLHGQSENYVPLAMATTIAFGLSMAGLMLGFAEKRRSLTLNTWIGIVGNLLVVGFFVLIVLIAVAA